jgi:hypothetical protein
MFVRYPLYLYFLLLCIMMYLVNCFVLYYLLYTLNNFMIQHHGLMISPFYFFLLLREPLLRSNAALLCMLGEYQSTIKPNPAQV